MPRPEDVLTAEDFERIVDLIEELHDAGRIDEATAIYKLMVAADQAGLRPGIVDEFGDEAESGQTRGDEDLAAGRIVPHDIVIQGPEAIREFRKRRDRGDVEPDTAAAIAHIRAAMAEQLAPHA